MTQVNYPFFIRKLRERAEFSRANNNYFDQLERILEQLYTFSNTDLVSGVDESSANENQIAQLYGLVADLSVAVADLAADVPVIPVGREFSPITVTKAYTACDRDYINAKSKAVITLPLRPSLNSVIIVRNGDGTVIGLNGNGKTINGNGTGKIYRKGTALNLRYFIDSDEWVAE